MSGLAVEFGAVGALSDTSDRPERLDKNQSAALGNAAVALPTHPAGSANLAPPVATPSDMQGRQKPSIRSGPGRGRAGGNDRYGIGAPCPVDPIDLLALFRVPAPVIFLPILGFLADLSGPLRGALMS